MKLRDMIVIAMFAGITAVLSQISFPVPFSPVPITMQPFAVVLAGAILGSKRGALALLVYALMGAVGLPVFAGGKAGIGVLMGPTGGYIIGFILAAFVIGKITETADDLGYVRTLIAMVAGLIIIYVLGVAQLMYVMKLPLDKGIKFGVGYYLPLDMIKILIGAFVGYRVRRTVAKAVPEFVA